MFIQYIRSLRLSISFTHNVVEFDYRNKGG